MMFKTQFVMFFVVFWIFDIQQDMKQWDAQIHAFKWSTGGGVRWALHHSRRASPLLLMWKAAQECD